MSKQINFYATENDRIMIANTLSNIFGQLIIIPFYKGNFSAFDIKTDERKLYLAEEKQQNVILYHTHEYYDGRTSEILSDCESPVLEYSLSFINSNGAYVKGRFYCCSDNTEFSKKVSKFFTKLKKEFWYVKKSKTYVSKSIDVENSLFLSTKITKEDLSIN